MLQIIHSHEVQASPKLIWDVICSTDEYPEWNPFIRACRSSFQVGDPIVMKVQLLPFLPILQRETILQRTEHELIDYGIRLPFGILSSSRKHILTSLSKSVTHYESFFELKGFFSPLVKFLLGKQLTRGFTEMTNALVARSLEKAIEKNK